VLRFRGTQGISASEMLHSSHDPRCMAEHHLCSTRCVNDRARRSGPSSRDARTSRCPPNLGVRSDLRAVSPREGCRCVVPDGQDS
jgi:hypothetical protein